MALIYRSSETEKLSLLSRVWSEGYGTGECRAGVAITAALATQ